MHVTALLFSIVHQLPLHFIIRIKKKENKHAFPYRDLLPPAFTHNN